ncbi:MAG: hypothetical protein TEF_17100 [Rhizobiales bacterium NRL2]|nr:MAG: hypothetical protein TEF_17100 [Rhizobiales bacterium NRL2]
MPSIFVAVAVLGILIILVAVLPRLEVRLPRRYRDIIYVRLRQAGARVEIFRGSPVSRVFEAGRTWTDDEQAAFNSYGVPVDLPAAARLLRGLIRPGRPRRFFSPILVLHPLDKALAGLDDGDRRALTRLGEELGGEVLIGELPTVFPDRAFQELRLHGMAPWNAN